MMINHGYSAADVKNVRATLIVPHRMRTRLSLLTLADEHVADLTPYRLDGQVDVDNTAAVTRAATFVLLDPRRRLPFDSDHPSDTAMFLDQMVRASYQVLVGDQWMGGPVFTGPITKLDRDGDRVTVECQGKELLAMGACWAPLTLHKGMKKTDAIQTILRERAGETHFDVPDLDARLPRHISLHRESVPWTVARHIARSMNMQLFYDGAGVCRLRRHPAVTVLSFTGQTHVTSPITVSYSGDTINTVWVKGAVPKGAKNPVTYTAVAPANHPLSPTRLGRNGVPRYLLPSGKVVENSSIRSVAEAKAFAERKLGDGLLQSVQVSFDTVPIPFLDPGDKCHVATDDTSVTFRLAKFSLPLTAGSAMSVGYLRSVSLLHRRRHHHHRPKPHHRPHPHHRR